MTLKSCWLAVAMCLVGVGNAGAKCYLHHGESPGETAEDAAGEAVESWIKDVTSKRGKEFADWRNANELRMVCEVITRGSRKGQERAWTCSLDGEARRDGEDCD
jgi:hypothetical protein